MAVRLKDALRAGISMMFPSQQNRYITPMIARSEFIDWIDSLLDGPSVQATDSTIIIDRSTPGVIRIRADTSGGTPTPVTYPTLRFGTSSDATPTAGELSVVGALGQGTITAYSGNMHHLIARLATEGDISSVLYGDDASNTNQIGAFAKYGSTVGIGGDAYNVWVSNQALTQGADVTLTVS